MPNFFKTKPGSITDDAKSQLGGIFKGVGKQFADAPRDAAKTIGQQFDINPTEALEAKDAKKKKPEKAPPQEDKDLKDFLKDMYGASNESNDKKQPAAQNQNILQQIGVQKVGLSDLEKAKTPEEQEKIIKAQQELQELHRAVYFEPTFNRKAPARPEEVQEEGERAADRMERLHKEDLQKKQVEEEKKQPVAVTMERNKTEQFRGAAG